MRLRRGLIPVALAAVLALLSGCVGGTASAPGDPRSGGGLAYGLAPAPNQGTTFQKDVVLVEGGADSVRSVTADGLTWTLSPDAGGIQDLAVGRVMFLTDRGVGRVAAVRTTDAGVEVTIGPVDLTEVIADGEFATKEPIPLDDPVVTSGEGAFWTDPELLREAGYSSADEVRDPVAPAGLFSPAAAPTIPRPPAVPAIVSETIDAVNGGFKLKAGCCKQGLGASYSYAKNGLTMTGDVKLAMETPKAEFRLKISGGSVKSAGLSVSGAGGLTAKLHAETEPQKPTNGYSDPLMTDIAFTVPMGEFFGVPLSMHVKQQLILLVNIPGQAVFDAEAALKLGATLGFDYKNGKLTNISSATFDAGASLDGINSIAVGQSMASFEYKVRFTVGLGYLGFVAGVFVDLDVHTTAVVSAPFGINIAGGSNPIEVCKSVQGELWLDYGVGYSIPTSVQKLVNYFLKAFDAQPIPATGGLSAGAKPVLTSYTVLPDTPLCRKR